VESKKVSQLPCQAPSLPLGRLPQPELQQLHAFELHVSQLWQLCPSSAQCHVHAEPRKLTTPETKEEKKQNFK
jgi:hypothetical protein